MTSGQPHLGQPLLGQLRNDGTEVDADEVRRTGRATMVTVTVELGGDGDGLEAEDIWPDGAPKERWQAADVAAVIAAECPTVGSVVGEWTTGVHGTVQVADDLGNFAWVDYPGATVERQR